MPRVRDGGPAVPARVLAAAIAGLALLLLLPARAAAQATDLEQSGLARGFVGAGLAVATSDSSSRMRLYENESHQLWMTEGGVAVSSVVGLGFELNFASEVVGSTSGNSFHASGRQQERLLLGLVRLRSAGEGRWSVNVVGGAGVLFQHHERRFAPCFQGCSDTINEQLDHKAPTFTVGAEVPLLVARHFAVSPFFRVWVLARGDNGDEIERYVPWQYEWSSSTRIGAGVTGRVVW